MDLIGTIPLFPIMTKNQLEITIFVHATKWLHKNNLNPKRKNFSK